MVIEIKVTIADLKDTQLLQSNSCAPLFSVQHCVCYANTPRSPGWLYFLMSCVYLSQTRPKDTPGWCRVKKVKEAVGEVVWSGG